MVQRKLCQTDPVPDAEAPDALVTAEDNDDDDDETAEASGQSLSM